MRSRAAGSAAVLSAALSTVVNSFNISNWILVNRQIQDGATPDEKAAADAKTVAEKAAADARAAAKSAEDAAKPGALNLTIDGDFDDQVAILVDGVEVATSHGKTIALEHVWPGPRKLSVRAKEGAKQLEAAYMVDVKPGLQNFQVVLR